MSHSASLFNTQLTERDYSLVGINAASAVEKGLAEADWYQCPVSRESLRRLLERRDGPAIRDTILGFALVLCAGFAACLLWGTWWALAPYVICPAPYPGLIAAWQEIFPIILRQMRDPAYHVKRRLPPPRRRVLEGSEVSRADPDSEGWIDVCDAGKLKRADVIRFDHGKKTYALYRDEDGSFYATDGLCTHGNTHLSDGLVKDKMIECPKHNGRFNLIDGSPARAPICCGLATYPIEERRGRICINVKRPGGAGARSQTAVRFRVVANRSVATFIKELVLEPENPLALVQLNPGDYLQFDIPAYEEIRFREFDISEPFATVWRNQHVFDLAAHNPESGRRNNYSLAGNPKIERTLRFNVRIAIPPPGQDCAPGVGSSYVFSLKPGDTVTAVGPYGDFHIKPAQHEMIYIGGGAGMAPPRAHLSHLFETELTARKVSFWCGARSKQEIFYDDYFRKLENDHHNFTFHLAPSSPLQEDKSIGYTGFIHEIVQDKYLGDTQTLRPLNIICAVRR